LPISTSSPVFPRLRLDLGEWERADKKVEGAISTLLIPSAPLTGFPSGASPCRYGLSWGKC